MTSMYYRWFDWLPNTLHDFFFQSETNCFVLLQFPAKKKNNERRNRMWRILDHNFVAAFAHRIIKNKLRKKMSITE